MNHDRRVFYLRRRIPQKNYMFLSLPRYSYSQVFTRCCYYWVNPRLKQYFSIPRLCLQCNHGNQKMNTDERVLEKRDIPFRCLPVCIGFISVWKCSESIYFWSHSIFKLGFLVYYHPFVCIQIFSNKNTPSPWMNIVEKHFPIFLASDTWWLKVPKKWYQCGFVPVINVLLFPK